MLWARIHSMIRYIAWAIPSIGFLGTVRGIGDALSQAHQAIEGNIFGVTRSLGVAFNSTLIALLVSLLLMFILHQLQLLQERFILDTEEIDSNVSPTATGFSGRSGTTTVGSTVTVNAASSGASLQDLTINGTKVEAKK